ncbi:hypothetical protein ACP275_02G094000 [Erythranthe tilingii]
MELGKFQTDLQAPAIAMDMYFYFNAGKYNGSTLCIFGRNPIMSQDRELSVVGGTGAFRMARGYLISNISYYMILLPIIVFSYMMFMSSWRSSSVVLCGLLSQINGGINNEWKNKFRF